MVTPVPAHAASTSWFAARNFAAFGVVATLAVGGCSGVNGSPSAAATASPSAGGGAASSGATLSLTASNSMFSAATLEAPADKPFSITFENQDAGVMHDVGIEESVLLPGAALRSWSLIFDGQDVTGPGQATNNVPPLKAGTYKFVCTFHAASMTGSLTVR